MGDSSENSIPSILCRLERLISLTSWLPTQAGEGPCESCGFQELPVIPSWVSFLRLNEPPPRMEYFPGTTLPEPRPYIVCTWCPLCALHKRPFHFVIRTGTTIPPYVILQQGLWLWFLSLKLLEYILKLVDAQVNVDVVWDRVLFPGAPCFLSETSSRNPGLLRAQRGRLGSFICYFLVSPWVTQ